MRLTARSSIIGALAVAVIAAALAPGTSAGYRLTHQEAARLAQQSGQSASSATGVRPNPDEQSTQAGPVGPPAGGWRERQSSRRSTGQRRNGQRRALTVLRRALATAARIPTRTPRPPIRLRSALRRSKRPALGLTMAPPRSAPGSLSRSSCWSPPAASLCAVAGNHSSASPAARQHGAGDLARPDRRRMHSTRRPGSVEPLIPRRSCMSTSRGIERSASRLRSIAGAALTALGVLIAVGVGALMITSMSASRAIRPPSFTAPCPETCSGCGYRPQRRTRRTLLPATTGDRLPGCSAGTAGRSRLASHGSPDAHQR